MAAFIKTRAAADCICRNARNDLFRNLAIALLIRLDTCEAALASSNGDAPAFPGGLLRGLVITTRELAGPSWLAARGGDPDIAALTALDTRPGPPPADALDEILSRVLWARFAPAAGAGRHHQRNGPRS